MKINYILAIVAVVGGVTAAFTNHSTKNNFYPTWKFENEKVGGEKVHYISANHLADMLYQKEIGIELLDVREEEAYNDYHIFSAIPFENSDLDSEQDIVNKTIIYGSVDDDNLLPEILDNLPGEIYVLKGGIEAWYSMVLFPDFLKYPVRNQDKLEQIIRKSRFFGGSPRNNQMLNITVRQSSFREGC